MLHPGDVTNSKWLRLLPLPTTAPLSGPGSITVKSSTSVPEIYQLANVVLFEPWNEFPQYVSDCFQVLSVLDESDARRYALSLLLNSVNAGKSRWTLSYNNLQTQSSVGAETISAEFRTVLNPAKTALQLPELRRELSCDPDEILFQVNESLSLSKHLIEVSNNKTLMSGQNNNNSFERTTAADTATVVNTSTVADTSPIPTRDVKPDLNIRHPDQLPSDMPILVVESKKPALQLAQVLEVEDREDQGLLSKKLSALFENLRRGGASKPRNLEMVTLMAVSQAALYGLHSKSGCVILTNYNEMLFLRISVSGTSRLQIAVSPLYDGENGFCALVACLKYVLSNSFDVDWLERRDMMQYLGLSGSLDKQNGENKTNKTNGNDGMNSVDGVGMDASGNTAGCLGNEVSENDNKKRGVKNSCGSPNGDTEAFSVILSGSSRTVGKDDSRCVNIGSPDSVMYSGRPKEMTSTVLYNLMNKNYGFLSDAGYNKLLKCRFRGHDVVAKYFGCLEERKQKSRITHERYIHSLLERKQRDGRYGEFVSEMVAYGYLPTFGLVLLIEFVGQPVEENETECGTGRCWTVGGVQVDDVNGLCGAAVSSLKRLHDVGILHGDVALRNMRARQLRGELEGWHVWWLDLGLAEETDDKEKLVQELKSCREMFGNL